MERVPSAPARIIRGAESIILQEGNSRGVLLLHGFGDTPQTLARLARYLHARGFDVSVPLLPGHGRNVDAFVASSAAEWLDFARQQLRSLRRTHRTVAVGGLSMGGALAATLAAESGDIAALVLLAPYLGMSLSYRLASMSHRLWGGIAGVRPAKNPGSILDPAERSLNLGYGVYTGRLLHELWLVAEQARDLLHAVTAPTLIVQSRQDPRIRERVARRALARLGAKDRKLVLTEGAGHIITVDFGRELVFAEVRDWLEAHMARS